jgi:hypothetical protein
VTAPLLLSFIFMDFLLDFIYEQQQQMAVGIF